MPLWDKALGIIADIIQIGEFFNFDKVTNINNTTSFVLILLLVAWLITESRHRKEKRAMQSEIDKMAREIRVLREDALKKRGLTQKDINKIFPPDDHQTTRRKQ
jgi:hypothetical protein